MGSNSFAAQVTCRDCTKVLYKHCFHEVSARNRALVGQMEQHHIRRGQAAVAPEEQVEPRLSEPEPEVPSPRGPTRAASAPIASTTMAPAPTVSVSIGPVVVATVLADSVPSGVTQIQLRKDRLLTEAKELEIEEDLIDDLSYAELKELVTSMRP